MESPFDVLRVDADADDEEIEQAYRARVKDAHPDQGGSVEEFQRVRAAYERIQSGYSERGSSPDSRGPRRPSADDERASASGDAGREGATSDPDGDAGADPEPTPSRVTYLNYDVLADFGWAVDDENLFAKAADAGLDEVDFGRFRVPVGRSLLEAAEARGFEWPFACRGGACANCAIMLREGELSMPVSHVLPSDLMEQGFRLSCNAMPITDELKVVYNVKHMPELEELLLPPRPFEQAYSD